MGRLLALGGLLSALTVLAGCSQPPAPPTRIINKTLEVGGFPVRIEKVEIRGSDAILFWSAPRAAKFVPKAGVSSPTASKGRAPAARATPIWRRHLELATGPNSYLIALDGLRLPMKGEPAVQRDDKGVRGTVTFDAAGLTLSKLGRIEIDGAAWVQGGVPGQRLASMQRFALDLPGKTKKKAKPAKKSPKRSGK